MGNNSNIGWKGWKRQSFQNGFGTESSRIGGGRDYGMPPAPSSTSGSTSESSTTYGPTDAPIPMYEPLDKDGKPVPPPIYIWNKEHTNAAHDALMRGDGSAFVSAMISIRVSFVNYDLDVVDYAQVYFLPLETAFDSITAKLTAHEGKAKIELTDEEKKLLEISIALWDASGRPPTAGYHAVKKLLSGQSLSRGEAIDAATFVETVGPSSVPVEYRAQSTANLVTGADDEADRLRDSGGVFGIMSL